MKYFNYFDNEEEKAIDRRIASETADVIHGILVFNIDNFVVVNEMYGHAMGNQIIKQVNDKIKNLFRGEDIVVKLRGDEFIVLNCNIKELRNVEILATKLLTAVSSVYVNDAFKLSASVGVAIYPFHGKDYSELKNKAYQAMYRAKSNEKNTFRLYDAAITKILYYDYLYNREQYEAEKDLETMHLADKNSDFIDVCTKIFREESNAISALNSTMELVCIMLGFSRVYAYSGRDISEEAAKKLKYANSGYEFGKESPALLAIREDVIARLIEKNKGLSIYNFDDSSLDEEIVDYFDVCGITQMLIFPIYNNDVLRGIVVFENMDSDKIEFTPQEFYQMEMDFNSLQSYYYNTINKKSTKEQLAKLEIFENIDACVYIVNSDNHEIEFMNRKATIACGDNLLGSKCYQSFCNKDHECHKCPLKNMSKDDVRANASTSSFNFAIGSWCKNLYSWLDVRDNKGKLLIISVEIDDFFEETAKIK